MVVIKHHKKPQLSGTKVLQNLPVQRQGPHLSFASSLGPRENLIIPHTRPCIPYGFVLLLAIVALALLLCK
jgi:hypothetical protein